jgi:hypothetical protein
MILRDKPFIFEVLLSQLVSKQDWSKTYMKASKNHNNVVGEERLAHIRTIVVSLGGKLTYVLFYTTTELHQWRYVVIFGECWSYFVFDDLILFFVAFVELLGPVDAFFCCFWDYFGYLRLAVGHWSEYESTIGPWWGWFGHASAGPFNCMCEYCWLLWSIFYRYTNLCWNNRNVYWERFCHSMPAIRNSGWLSFVLVRTVRLSCIASIHLIKEA